MSHAVGRGPHPIVTTAATNATIRPLMRGSQCEPEFGKSCQLTFIDA